MFSEHSNLASLASWRFEIRPSFCQKKDPAGTERANRVIDLGVTFRCRTASSIAYLGPMDGGNRRALATLPGVVNVQYPETGMGRHTAATVC
jgi:hypothetical protein